MLADQPDEILAVHRAYVEAGATVLVSASYQVSRTGFIASGRTASDADEMLARSVRLAREAVQEHDALVAASVGPYGAVLHDGSEYRGRYGVSREFLVDFHAERLSVLAEAEPDLFACETIPDADEADVLAECLAEYPSIPAWVCFSCADDRRTCAGQPIEEAVSSIGGAESVVAVGVNCTAPAHVTSLLERMGRTTDLPLVVYPNSGRSWDPVTGWSGSGSWRPGGSSVPPLSGLADDDVHEWSARAALIGGCCGVGPDDVARLTALLPPVR